MFKNRVFGALRDKAEDLAKDALRRRGLFGLPVLRFDVAKTSEITLRAAVDVVDKSTRQPASPLDLLVGQIDSLDPSCRLVLTADGTQETLAELILATQEYGFGVLAFVDPTRLDAEDGLTRDELRVALGCGVVVGLHLPSSDRPLGALREAIRDGCTELTELTHYPIRWLSVPDAGHDVLVAEARAAGLNGVLSATPGLGQADEGGSWARLTVKQHAKGCVDLEGLGALLDADAKGLAAAVGRLRVRNLL